MKYDNGLMLDNQADYYRLVHARVQIHTYTEWHKVKEEERESERKGDAGNRLTH